VARVGTTVQLGEGLLGGTAPFVYAWGVTAPAGSSAALSDASAARPTFTPDVPGNFTFTLAVTDSHAMESPVASVTLTAFDPPAPTASARASPDPALTGTTVTLGESVLGGVAPYTYTWSFNSLPLGSGAVLSDPLAARPTFVPDLDGAYDLHLVVTDSVGHSSTSTVSVTVGVAGSTPIVAPTAAPDPTVVHTRVQLGERVLGGTAPFTYHWSVESAPETSAAALSSATAARPNFAPDVPGNYTLALSVTDAHHMTSSTATTALPVVATPPIAAPIAVPDPALTGATVHLGESVVGGVYPYTYTWSFTGLPVGSAAVLSGPHAAKPTFVPDVPGSYQVSLTVTDARLESSAPATVTVVVPS
jgi:hypothetical protein